MGQHSTITFREMMAHMESGKPFSLSYITYSRKRRQGGKLKHWPEAVMLTEGGAEQPAPVQGQRAPTVIERARDISAGLDSPRRRPNHHDHFTRNLRVLQQGQPTSIVEKFHPPLVIKFNDCDVL